MEERKKETVVSALTRLGWEVYVGEEILSVFVFLFLIVVFDSFLFFFLFFFLEFFNSSWKTKTRGVVLGWMKEGCQ